MAGADVPASGGKGGRRISIYIDMTPMVDVIILLLIFFFMTSQFKEPAAVEIRLPQPGIGEKTVNVKESNVLTVEVDADGVISVVDTRNRDGKIVTLDELGEYIGSRQSENPELITIIDVSPEATYSDMMDVLDEFKMASEQTGVKKISLRLEEVTESAATAEAGG
ncbi:MAG: biopolymer transporter ExbD [Candidatus Zixiibacteriota bacterium]|jgi:biopolymer transport protein ExbD